jgi:hypothetical protein
MLTKAYAIVRENIAFYFIFVCLVLAINWFRDMGYIQSSAGVVNAIPWIVLAYFVHQAALFNAKFAVANPDGTKWKSSQGGFVLKAFALGLLALALSAPVLLYGLSKYPPSPGHDDGKLVLGFGLALLLAYTAVLSLLGSWLPASIYQRNPGIGSAFTRGRANFFSVFVRILPTLLIATSIELATLELLASRGIDLRLIVNGLPNLPAVAAEFFTTCVEAFNVTLVCVILSHHYLVFERSKEPLHP